MALASSLKHSDYSHAIETLARVGYATKGLVYLFIGGLATMYAFGMGGALTGGEGAAQAMEAQPFGVFLLWATGIGLAAYALWQSVRAVLDPEGGENDTKNIARRVGYGVSAVLHVAFSVAVIQMAMGTGSSGGDTKTTYLAKIMDMPGGNVIVGIAAAAVVGFGLYQFYRGYEAKFMKKLKSHEMNATERTWSLRVGRAGLMARGVVSCILGYFLFEAASSGSASQAKGVGGALQSIASESYGMILLAIVALGLVAYAIHQFFTAKYRRIDAHV